MNAIFFKEVPDSVLKGKLVKLNYTDIGNKDYVIEINISNKVVKCINKDNANTRSKVIIDVKKHSWIKNLDTKHTLFRFKRSITKIINKNDLIGYSIVYSNDLKKNKNVKDYVGNIFSFHSINEYVNTNSVEENLNKYIEEYINKNSIDIENISPLIILNDIETLNFDIINNLNKKYKEVNVYTDMKPNKQFFNRIKNINDEYGSCISVLNKSQKDLKKYNVCIFVDKSRSEYAKHKFNRKACFIDFTNKENDRFNNKYIKVQSAIKSNKYSEVKIKELFEVYGKITVSTIIADYL